MRIELDKLEELKGQFSHVFAPTELSLEDRDARLTEPAEVSGKVARRAEEVGLTGVLRAKVEVDCDRCLKPVTLPIRAEFEARFVPAVAWGAEEQHELREEDLNLSVFDGVAIELKELVREELLLAIPGHVLCREDCKGLCQVCGSDLNAGDCGCEKEERDPRWAALGNLQV